MENLDFIKILELLNLIYIGLVILGSLSLFKLIDPLLERKVRKSNLKSVKLLITTGIGIFFGVAGYFLQITGQVVVYYHYNSPSEYVISILLSFFCSIYFYDLIVKHIINKLSVSKNPPKTDSHV
jgi:nitric oxide reductase large subunit